MASIRTIVGSLVLLPAAIVVFFLLLWAGFEARKAYWDHKVIEMCEKEAGIKIFKTVHLDPETYDSMLDDQKRIRLQYDKLAKPGDRFAYSMGQQYIVRGHLQIVKYTERVIERAEGTVLAEQTSFARQGGDFLPLDNPTSFQCPRQPNNLYEQALIRR